MASSKLLVTRTNNNNNSDLPLPRRDSSISSSSLSTLIADHSTMDDLLNNIYNHNRNSPPPPPRTVDEVWKDIVAGGGDDEASAAAAADSAMEADHQVRAAGAGEVPADLEEMTLEDFLTRAGAVREEDVAGAAGVPIGYGQFQVQPPSQGGGQLVYNNNNGTTTSTSGGGGGRGGKRRAVQEAPLDKATQQKQRRMIKNRESAARSRERKQAYTIELESLVTQLEQENARLVTQQAEQKKERYKWLMENLIPVVEKRRPPRALRRVQSVHW